MRRSSDKKRFRIRKISGYKDEKSEEKQKSENLQKKAKHLFLQVFCGYIIMMMIMLFRLLPSWQALLPLLRRSAYTCRFLLLQG